MLRATIRPLRAERDAELEGPRWIAVALTPADAPALQAFFAANPLFSEIVNGEPWTADAADKELHDRPPADWPQGESRFWAVIERGSGHWLGFLDFTEDLLAPGIWHLGFFIVATAEHGSGLAHEVHRAWAAHAEHSGARWLRLGVVVTNERAVAFWERLGYAEVRQRHGATFGRLTHSVSVRVKPLGEASLKEHLARVPRDRPDL